MPKESQLLLHAVQDEKRLVGLQQSIETSSGVIVGGAIIFPIRKTGIETAHSRGTDEMTRRALKDFTSKTLVFQRLSGNAVFY